MRFWLFMHFKKVSRKETVFNQSNGRKFKNSLFAQGNSLTEQWSKMKFNSATFLKFAMVFSYKTFKWTKNVLKNAKIDRRITLQIIVANCTCSKPQLTPFQNILEMNLPMAIFSEKTANCNILRLHHISKAKRHNISQFGTYRMLIS